jgi:serine O-acetyltransferase
MTTRRRDSTVDLGVLREDWRVYSPHPLLRGQFHVLALYRLGRRLGEVRGGPGRVLAALRTGAQFLSQTLYGVELTWHTTLGRRVTIGHLGGIVIAPGVVMGDDCIIRQNVTIGAATDGGEVPRIGHRVEIGAGAVLIGAIEIGDDVLIGPNAVVTTNVPDGARVVALPSRVIPRRGTTPTEAAERRAGLRRPVDPDAVAAVIKSVVKQSLLDGPDVPLVSSGLVDSLNLVLVIDALEAAFGVTIPSEAFNADQFDTARDIAAYIGTESIP